MIEAIVEVWCSPLRQEDYSIKIIPLCAGDLFNVEGDIKDDYISWTGDFFTDAFGKDYEDVKGLWKVVFKIGVRYTQYFTWDGPDGGTDFTYTELFKGQCDSWTEMKYTWLELNGKAEEYFNKPWRKHLGFYEDQAE